jgi:hypothetical protein
MMRSNDTSRPEPSRAVEGELSAVREAPEVNQGKAWQELKGRIRALRRELHQMPVSLIGGSWWADRIRELEECQRKLELLSAPQSLRPPDERVKFVLLGNTLHLNENRPRHFFEGLKAHDEHDLNSH